MSEVSGLMANKVLVTVVAFIVVFGLFYGLNHLIMGMQGLPLNMDLTPVQ